MKRVSLQASNSSTDRVLVGRIGRPHGLDGYVVLHPETDNPDRFSPGSTVLDASGALYQVERVRPRGEGFLVRFSGVEDRTAAERIVGTELYISGEERRALDDGEYWPDELIGLVVHSHDGREVGVVGSVIEGAAQYRLAVEGDRGTFEVPFVVDLVPTVDRAEGMITLADIPGLIPDE